MPGNAVFYVPRILLYRRYLLLVERNAFTACSQQQWACSNSERCFCWRTLQGPKRGNEKLALCVRVRACFACRFVTLNFVNCAMSMTSTNSRWHHSFINIRHQSVRSRIYPAIWPFATSVTFVVRSAVGTTDGVESECIFHHCGRWYASGNGNIQTSGDRSRGTAETGASTGKFAALVSVYEVCHLNDKFLCVSRTKEP